VQVGQVEQQLLQSIESGLTQQQGYRSDLDQFKLQLGLPMKVRLEVDDEQLQPMYEQTRRFEEISGQYEDLSTLVQQYARPGEERLLRERLRRQMTEGAFVRQTRFRERIGRQLDEWAKMPPAAPGARDPLEEKLEALVRRRDELREKREQLKDKEKGDLPKDDLRRLEDLEFQVELGRYERALRGYERRFWLAEKDPARRAILQSQQFTLVYRYFLALLEDAFRERQERVRGLWPELPALCVGGVDLLSDDDDKVLAAASRTALTYRLDLMNQRAQLVDSWRKIRVAANALLGVLTVQYHYDVSTPPNKFEPFNFQGSRSHHQLIVNASPPLVRILQRDAYRATLIAWQQQRRQLQQAEDQVLFDVRSQLRILRAFAYNYQNVQKRAIELAYSQVDQSLQAFSQPQAPAGPTLPTGIVGPPATPGGAGDPAALTNQLLTSQNSLLRAQNDLYNTWIAYLTSRISIYRDMGIMRVDPRGVWIDDVATCQCRQYAGPDDGKADEQRPAKLPEPNELPARPPEQLPPPRPVPNPPAP